ncbi:MAG: precorrin-3B C(17)-methyltransferase [Candidatus Bathyarchaeota archaeon]|nr:precorrin-3B C(17)-methyltransferase [Candidatus Bathyarchaeota archaeon]
MRTRGVNNCGKKCSFDVEKDETERRDGGSSRGRISVVGIGPGALEHMTPKAMREIECADVVVGYVSYVKLVRSIVRSDAEVISGRMGCEVERARTAVAQALKNKHVVVISSGDSGVYGMAGVVLEVAAHENADVSIEIVPGVTAATAAAAKLGAPLMGDFAVISLSDLLTPWSVIEKRLVAAAEADFVVVLYNPQSVGRREPLAKAHEILLRYRSPATPVGIVRLAGREGEHAAITTLKEVVAAEVDMVTTVIVGNSATRVVGNRLVTSRGYDLS